MKCLRMKTYRIAVVAAAALAACMVRPADAAMAVIDSSNLAKNAETAATTAKQLIEIKNVLEAAKGILGGVGGKGNPIQSAFQMGSGGPGGLLGVSYGTAGFYPKMDNLNLPKSLGVPNLSNVQGAIEFVRRALEKVNPSDKFTTLATLEERRERVAYDSAFDNYAVALHHKQTAADASTRVSALANQARLATDLRQDTQANTSILLAILEELIGIRSLLAGQLEDQTVTRIRAIRATYPGSGEPKIGSAFQPFGAPAPGDDAGSTINQVLQ